MTQIKSIFSAAVMLAMFSCSTDEYGDMNQSNGVKIINATTESDECLVSRSGEDGSHLVKNWQEDEAISLFSGSNNQKLMVYTQCGTTNPIFSGCYENCEEYYAVYPYNAANKKEFCNNDVVIAWNGREQVAVNGAAPKNTPLMAYTKADDNMHCPELKFMDVCAYLKFTLKEECWSVKITANDNSHYISAKKIFVSLNDNNEPKISLFGDGSNKVTLVGENGSVLGPGTYYVAVAPGKMIGGLMMEVTRKSSQVYTSTLNEDVNAVRKGVVDLSDLIEAPGDLTDPFRGGIKYHYGDKVIKHIPYYGDAEWTCINDKDEAPYFFIHVSDKKYSKSEKDEVHYAQSEYAATEETLKEVASNFIRHLRQWARDHSYIEIYYQGGESKIPDLKHCYLVKSDEFWIVNSHNYPYARFECDIQEASDCEPMESWVDIYPDYHWSIASPCLGHRLFYIKKLDY